MTGTEIAAWVGALAGVAAVLWGVGTSLVNRSRKELTYSIPYRGPLLPDNASTIHEPIRVKVGDTELDNPELVLVDISNTGNRPISRQDFDGPLTLQIEGPSHLWEFISGNLRGTKGDLEPDLTWEPWTIYVEPLLLNPGDALYFALIVSGPGADIRLRARIAGVTRIRGPRRPTRLNRSDTARMVASGAVTIALSTVALQGGDNLLPLIGLTTLGFELLLKIVNDASDAKTQNRDTRQER